MYIEKGDTDFSEGKSNSSYKLLRKLKHKTWEWVRWVYLVSETELKFLDLGEFHFRELREVQLKPLGKLVAFRAWW